MIYVYNGDTRKNLNISLVVEFTNQQNFSEITDQQN